MEIKNKNNSYIYTAGAMGALGGTIYGFKHPSEQACKKLSQMGPTIIETLQGYKDSFNKKAANEAVTTGKLDLLSYEKFKKIYESISDTLEKEKIVKQVLETPISERTKSFKDAVKEANKARAGFRKAMFGFSKKLQNQFIELKIFDKETFTQTIKATKKKTISAYKELSKGALKYLAIGLAAGVAIGAAFKLIIKDK